MQNPNSILWHNMEVLSAANGRTSGNQGGCPPDGTTIVDMPVTLERQGLPVAPELQSVQKKGRSEEETMIVEDTSMEGLGDAGLGTQRRTVVGMVLRRILKRGVEVGFPCGTMGSRFEVLEDEVVVMGDWPAVEGHAAFSTSNQGAKGVVIEPLGSAKLRVGVSAGSPRKRDDVKEGQIVSSGTESGLYVRESMSIEGVETATEGLPRKQGVVASQGDVVPGDSSLDNSKHSMVKVVDTGSYGRLVFECTHIDSPRPVLVSDMVTNEGDWDWSRVRGSLPKAVVECMAVTRHIAISDECALCHGGPEDVNHVFRSCVYARDFWPSVLSPESVPQLFVAPFEDWFHDNINNGMSVGDGRAVWNVRFSIYCWLLWKLRCSKVLDADYVERESILDRGNRLIDTCALAFEAPQHHLSSGFTVGHSVLVETIHALRRSDWQTRITHIGRERNEVADKLAALGKHQSLEGVVFAALPDAVGVG
ncbi:hypothetical protein V6N12_049258 [Hibiscus sabdariffa]|uniref:RNase H type-1 domain-containing protein n=1 Tax=Hibiscus sabdariffa TaxID=183260 RepID=A0ABR2EJN7_9ROSI